MREDSTTRRNTMEDFPVEMLLVGGLSAIAAIVFLAHPDVSDAWRALIVTCAWFAGTLIGWKGPQGWDALMHGLPPMFPNATAALRAGSPQEPGRRAGGAHRILTRTRSLRPLI